MVTNTNFHAEGVLSFDLPSSLHVKVNYAKQEANVWSAIQCKAVF